MIIPRFSPENWQRLKQRNVVLNDNVDADPLNDGYLVAESFFASSVGTIKITVKRPRSLVAVDRSSDETVCVDQESLDGS